MRGKGLRLASWDCIGGITPAYAGKRSVQCLNRIVHRDHPRLCGEKLKRQIESKQLKGSPPPMRGKVFSEFRKPPKLGITPAYAGKSGIRPNTPSPHVDHPRLCGEKSFVT